MTTSGFSLDESFAKSVLITAHYIETKSSDYMVSEEEEAENQTSGARKRSGSVYLELLTSLAGSQM